MELRKGNEWNFVSYVLREKISRCGRLELNFECFSPEIFALMSERQAWPLSN